MQYAFDRFARHEEVLAEKLLAFLRNQDNVRIIGMHHAVQDVRLPTISFAVAGMQSEDVVRHLDKFNIGIRFGDFYATQLIDALGLRAQGGVVRVSMAHYNSADEVDRLIGHLAEVS